MKRKAVSRLYWFVNPFLFLPSLIQERVFPAGCACCGENIFRAKEAFYGLCAVCEKMFSGVFTNGEKRCAVCGKPLISETETCMECRRESRFFDRLFAVFPYKGIYGKALKAYKFGSCRALGRFFSDCFLKAYAMLEEQCAVWIPVPPRPGKIRKTGWDQMEYIARILERLKNAGEKNVPVYRCLRRLRSGVQKSLDRENRKVNLAGKIQLMKKHSAPETALVFDDVYTTGATMNACARVLKENGAKKVYGICLFYS